MEFEKAFKAYVSESLQHTSPELRESIFYTLFAPGKRIRPRMALASSSLFDLPEKTGFYIASAVEMIHCFSLIHDDLPCMDDDDFRRGRQSNHKVFGEAMALLAGDALIPMAYSAVSRAVESVNDISRANLTSVFSEFSRLIGQDGLVGGQACELSKEQFSVDLIFERKTAALFEASVLLPALVAGSSREAPEYRVLLKFARSLGVAFQYADDRQDQDYRSQNYSEKDFLAGARKSTDSLRESLQLLRDTWSEKQTTPLISIAQEVLFRV